MEFIMKSFLPLLIIGLLIICLTANAQIPKKISYQGMLTTPNGTPVQDGSYSFQFKLYPTTSGGTPLWIETQVGVHVGRGVFNVFLGSVTPFNVSFSMPLFLEVITIGGPGISEPLTMLPRSEFTSSPYAMWSDTARYAIVTVPTGSAGGDLTGTFPNPVIANSVVTSAKILDSTIQRVDVVANFKSPYSDTADYARALSDTGAYLPVAGGVMQGAITSIGDQPITMGKGNFGSGNINTGDYSFVAGRNNQALGKYSVVSGGGSDTDTSQGNRAHSDWSTVGGGLNNIAGNGADFFQTVSGGVGNRAVAQFSTVGGGGYNEASGYLSVIGGGGNYSSSSDMINKATAGRSTISGGSGNSANGYVSAIGGGMSNIAGGSYSTIGGGQGNNSISHYSIIGGGYHNVTSGLRTVIAGGNNNSAIGEASVVVGGGDWLTGTGNVAGGNYSFVGAGRFNFARGNSSVVVGGGGENTADSNSALGHYSFIGGGLGNVAKDSGSIVCGGRNNYVGEIDGTIGGGSTNRIEKLLTYADARGITISGGTGNRVKAEFAGNSSPSISYTTICGGLNNIIGEYSPSSSIGGGSDNHIYGSWRMGSGGATTIGGGTNNYAYASNGTVGGGYNNNVQGYNSTVAGGANNTAGYFLTSGPSGSTIGGGENNNAVSYYATVSGGNFNIAGFNWSLIAPTVSGGQYDTAVASYSTVPGGFMNKASGDYSFAAGRRAKALNEGSFVWGDATDADFSSERDNQFRIRANGGAKFDVNNNNWVNIWDDGTNLINTSTNARLTLAGVWQSVSDRNQKENIIEVNSKEILKKLMQLPISLWNYKVEGDKIKHIGPMAQDFYSVFGVGSDDKTISSIDPAGVAFAAIQELSKQNEELRKQNEALNTRLNELEKLVKSIAGKNTSGEKSIGELR
jgi:hypothetical protein